MFGSFIARHFDFRPVAARQWVQLIFGLSMYGLAISFMMQSHFGLGPWDLVHQGINKLTGLKVGLVSELVGFALMAMLLVVDIRFGWGTISNIILIGLVTDLTMPFIPAVSSWPWQLGYYLVALLLCGIGIGAYIGANMGAGPRDSFMLFLVRRFNWPVRHVRTGIELSVLFLGWIMGGDVGWGTLLFAVSIGPAVQWGLKLFKALPHSVKPEPSMTEPVETAPSV